ALLGEPLIASAALSAGVLSRVKNEALASELLTGLVGGETMIATAWQETAAGIDPAVVGTRGEDQAGGISIRGRKTFVPAGNFADGFIVSALLDDSLALVWIPRDTPGLTVEPY